VIHGLDLVPTERQHPREDLNMNIVSDTFAGTAGTNLTTSTVAAAL
jgi:hypothetical protein